MEVEFVKRLKERARYFFEESKEDFKKKRFDICLFHLEQSAQLFLKAFLLERIGDFPKTNNLFEILEEAGRLEKRIKEVGEKYRLIVNILIDAYIASRYLARDYSEKECLEAFKFIKELIKCLR